MESGCKPFALGIAKTLAFFYSDAVFLACVLDLQFSLLFGPMIDVLVLLGLMGLGFVFSIVFIVLNRFKKIFAYIPLLLWGLGILLTITGLFGDMSHRFHYLTNKDNLEAIDQLSKQANIQNMTDMLRYSKRLNESYIGNGEDYSTANDIGNAFGEYISE
ncbi:hypothetical protein [Algoriphagus sp.]|uniref:hypothetical protein n=1 Tax=Algoriphagus sp. TaxID=1872435 RepID=UPI003F720692